MSYNTIERTANGEIVLLTAYDRWNYPERRNLRDTIYLMTAGDIENLLAECGGDLSQLHPLTAQAMSIKAKELAERRKEQEERQKKYREARRKAKHDNIIDEIRAVCGDMPSFTATQVQLAAAKQGNGFPVRTRQMYSRHMAIAVYEDDTMERAYIPSKTVNVIYANGRSGKQDIRAKDAGYRFR